MNIHLVEKIRYGGRCNANGRKIVLHTAKGRKTTERNLLYDDEF